MHKPKFLGWRVLSSLNGCQECHRIASRRALLQKGRGRGDGHRVITLRKCLGGFFCSFSYICISSRKPCLHMEERGSGSLWFACVGWAPSALACTWQNAATARYLLISSYKPTSEVGLGFLTSSTSGSTTPLNEGKTPRIYFRRCVKCFFPIRIPWCGMCRVYRTTACCLLGYLGQCRNQLWQRRCSLCAQTSGIFIVLIPAHGRLLEWDDLEGLFQCPSGILWFLLECGRTAIWIVGLTGWCQEFCGNGQLLFLGRNVWFDVHFWLRCV